MAVLATYAEVQQTLHAYPMNGRIRLSTDDDDTRINVVLTRDEAVTLLAELQVQINRLG